MESEKPRNALPIIMSLDIETGGKLMTRHPLVRVAAVVMNADEHVIEAREWPIPFCIESFEKKCLDEFWKSPENPGLYEKLQRWEEESKSFSTKEQLKDFRLFYDRMCREYPDLQIVSDLPEFDVGVLNYHFSMHGLDPLSYANGEYRGGAVCSEQLLQFTREDYRYHRFFSTIDTCKKVGVAIHDLPPHSHNPLDDAKRLAMVYLRVYRKHYGERLK